MRLFRFEEIDEALAYARGGDQALHLHRVILDRCAAPRCFVAAIDRGEEIAHLFDLDAVRLTRTARSFGVRVVYLDREGTDRQHVDLCGGPLRRALALCDRNQNRDLFDTVQP